MNLSDNQIFELLETKAEFYENPSFIELDPISIPKKFAKNQDIEVSAFFASMIAWGNRTMILKKANHLMELMDNSPYEFIINHTIKDLTPFHNFVYRTLSAKDLIFFINRLKEFYSNHQSLEYFFIEHTENKIENGLNNLHNWFFSTEYPKRALSYLSAPQNKSGCKRLNMFLRWMVRNEKKGVDFGIWKQISPKELKIPCDVHVINTSLNLGLLNKKTVSWRTVMQLTEKLKAFDPNDPVKYDFALFGLGIIEKFNKKNKF